MGYAITWCAVRESAADQIVKMLGLTPTGETEQFPESLISMGRFDTGWRVVWYNRYSCPFLREEDLAKLSLGQDVLLVLVEEHVMASSSALWSEGKRKWSVSHEGEDGPRGLSVVGDAPEALAAIRTEYEERQIAEGGDDADVDYIFEIPLKIAQSLVGFKHDEVSAHLIDGQFAVMSRVMPRTGMFGWLRK
jgi:hypothetical protein